MTMQRYDMGNEILSACFRFRCIIHFPPDKFLFSVEKDGELVGDALTLLS
jgi:hypothetical protein